MVGSDVLYRPGPYANVNQNSIHQQNDKSRSKTLQGFLKQDTVRMLWSPIIPATSSSSNKKSLVKSDQSDKVHYGMGWVFMPPSNRYAFCNDQRCVVSHTGGAMGASSVLLILPRIPDAESAVEVRNGGDKGAMIESSKNPRVPEGVVVTIICNTSNVSLSKLALDVAKIFETLRPASDGPYRVQKVYQC